MDANCSFQLSDAEWRVLEPVLIVRNDIADVARVRRTLDGILWVMHTGAPWQELPRAYGEPQHVNERFRTWALSGLLDELLDRLETRSSNDVTTAAGAVLVQRRSDAA